MSKLSADQLLLKSTSLNRIELDLLFQTHLSGGSTIGEQLLQNPSQSAEELVQSMCQMLGLEFISDIAINDIPVDLVRDIPINYAKAKEVLPFKNEKDYVKVLISNPLNYRSLDDLKVTFGKPVQAVITTSQNIRNAINQVYEKSSTHFSGLEEISEEEYDLDDPVIDLLDADEDDAPVIKLVNSLLFRAVKEKASDIHIEPYEKDMVVRFRIDGVLFDIFKPPKKLQNAITSRIKVMGQLNIAEKRLPQDGRIPLKLAGKDIDVRLSTLPTAFGERIVMRLQDRSNVILDLKQLGFSEQSLVHVERSLKKTYGILLVTGPTGAGKTNTLYSCLQRINTVDRNILTVEEPVEQRIHGIGQIQVNHKIGLTFAAGLRSILRQDPNVVMVGEIRDLETAEISINASLTGHIVLSTIHTNDSSGVFPRLIDMGCEPFLIATSLLGVVAQRLVRVLCPHCKEPYPPTSQEVKSMNISPEQIKKARFHKPVGCNECNQKGYIGRTMIEEFLNVTDEIRALIMSRKDGGAIRKEAISQGMQTFREHGINKALKGITSVQEVLSNTQMDT